MIRATNQLDWYQRIRQVLWALQQTSCCGAHVRHSHRWSRWEELWWNSVWWQSQSRLCKWLSSGWWRGSTWKGLIHSLQVGDWCSLGSKLPCKAYASDHMHTLFISLTSQKSTNQRWQFLPTDRMCKVTLTLLRCHVTLVASAPPLPVQREQV